MSDFHSPPNQPGTAFSRKVPDGDNMERDVCDSCGFVHYNNPKIVVGAIATWEDKILLCRRAIEPRKGFWTMPAGFLELNETAEDGARREAREEAEAELDIIQLLAHYSVPGISQVQLIYRARLVTPDVTPGIESTEVRLAGWADIPWTELAFPSVLWALKQFETVKDRKSFPPFTNPEGELGDIQKFIAMTRRGKP